MILPIMMALGIWTYNIVKIAGRAGCGKNGEACNPEDSGNENNITITNSAEAIRHIRDFQQAARRMQGHKG